MSAVDENQDLMALKALLTSWDVRILYDFFKDEDITIRELKMIDFNHIHSLLKDYKMGVKIRFEYNLKKWRHKLDIPLKAIETNHHCCCSCNRRCHANPHINDTTKTNAPLDNDFKRRRLDIDTETKNNDDHELNQASLSPQSVNSNASLINALNPDEIFDLGNTTASTNEKAHNTDNEVDMMPLQAFDDFLSDVDTIPTPKLLAKLIHEKYAINLLKILKMSGPRGMAIVKFFKDKNRLTTVYRNQLIQIIVDYFIDNDCHLPLNLSHNLERQILRIFPTEKLEYYRTEKRGKIYAKFSNMKRYKRERNLKANTELEMQTENLYSARDKTEEYETTNISEANDNSCCPTFDPELVVKKEYSDCD